MIITGASSGIGQQLAYKLAEQGAWLSLAARDVDGLQEVANTASKHAMAEFYASLRNELSETGVSVTVIYPGWVKTGITGRALRADGTKKGVVSSHEDKGMAADKCAKIIVAAAGRTKREVVMTFEGKLGLWLRLIAPSVVDSILKKKTDQ